MLSPHAGPGDDAGLTLERRLTGKTAFSFFLILEGEG